ncbi:hypothetical protein AcV5_001834 [Taiwanofungus camphoratus]|nr:hypothetical protein AcV5_001834 [Antrodia cinnamomea]
MPSACACLTFDTVSSFTGSLSKGNQEDPVYDKTVSYRHKGTLLFELNHISHQIKSICQTSQLRTTELVWFEARAHLCEISLGISYAHTVLVRPFATCDM